MIKKVTYAIINILCIILFFGCNTIHGVGKDIESGGKAIERSSGK